VWGHGRAKDGLTTSRASLARDHVQALAAGECALGPDAAAGACRGLPYVQGGPRPLVRGRVWPLVLLSICTCPVTVMIVGVFAHVQWRWAPHGSSARG
jgi:hypothetical protein